MRFNKKLNIKRIRKIFFATTFIVSMILILGYSKNSMENRNIYIELRTNDASGVEKVRVQKDIAALKKINKDAVGWIKVNGTDIDYPLLQTDNNKFYLTHNIFKQYSNFGSIFVDSHNDLNEIDTQKNIVIFGHNMDFGQMFSGLKEFILNDETPEFYQKNGTIEIMIQNRTYQMKVFSAYTCNKDFDYIKTNFKSNDEFIDFARTIKEKSVCEIPVEISKDDTIVTLSTCYYSIDSERIVVHGILIK